MSKRDNVLRVKKLLDTYNIKYEVKNYVRDLPSHIRLKGGADIWPATGTYKLGNVHTKGSIDNLMNYLHGLAGIKKSKDSLKGKEIDSASEIKLLNKLITRLELKVNTLEAQNSKLAHMYVKVKDDNYTIKDNLLKMERKLDELEQRLEFSSFNR